MRQILERAKGIEPSYAAWEAAVLPLNYARRGKTGFLARFSLLLSLLLVCDLPGSRQLQCDRIAQLVAIIVFQAVLIV
jgi:hypothetical protein